MNDDEARLVELVRRYLHEEGRPGRLPRDSRLPSDTPAAERTVIQDLRNPACGDRCTLYRQAGEYLLEGSGCALCRGSTALADSLLQRVGLADARRVSQTVLAAFSDGAPLADERDSGVVDEALELAALARRFPARLMCTRLPWQLLAVD